MKVKSLIILACIWFVACNKTDDPISTCSYDKLLDFFITQDGVEVFIYENGELFTNQEGNCVFELQYFEPEVLANAYQTNSEGIFIVSGGCTTNCILIQINQIQNIFPFATFISDT